MLPNTLPPPRTIDRNAVISLVAGLLTLAAVCIAVVPIPLTGYVCFPAAAMLALVAGVHGFRAVRQFGTLTRRERSMAIAGIAAGFCALLVAAGSLILLFALGLHFVQALRGLLR